MEDTYQEYLKAQEEYKNKFGSYLPSYSTMGRSPSERIALIKQCVAENKPFKPVKGRVY